MTFLLRSDLRAANSATQYPSIPTYHVMENGRLTDVVAVDFQGQAAICTEKLDGSNARIVAFPDGTYLIGSRTEWLTASGDLVANANMGIVDAVTAAAEALARAAIGSGYVYALYGEVFGGKIQAHKQYTSTGVTGFRAFDAWRMPVDKFRALLLWPLEEIASWRDKGGQLFMADDEFCPLVEPLRVRMVPSLVAQPPPLAPGEMLGWLREALPDGTRAVLDAGALGKPEGVVVRTPGRGSIAKIRFEDYERAARKAVRG